MNFMAVVLYFCSCTFNTYGLKHNCGECFWLFWPAELYSQGKYICNLQLPNLVLSGFEPFLLRFDLRVALSRFDHYIGVIETIAFWTFGDIKLVSNWTRLGPCRTHMWHFSEPKCWNNKSWVVSPTFCPLLFQYGQMLAQSGLTNVIFFPKVGWIRH